MARRQASRPPARQALPSLASHFDDGVGKACGASCGRLCPMPPVMRRWAYLPENFGIDLGVRMRRTVGVAFQGDGGNGDGGNSASRFSSSSYFDRPGRDQAASDSCGSRWRHGPGCRRTPRCVRRWRHRNSTSARRAARSVLKIRAGIFRSPAGRVRSRSNTGTTIAVRPMAATASCWPPGCRSDSR